MWFLKFDLEDIVDMVNNILRGLFANICKIIYPWIANLYDIFKDLGQLVYSDQFTAIYNKISLIIGIFMVFRVTFWLIESLVNPDTLNDKEKNPGKIIQKVLVAVILLATTPTIFEYAFKLQNKIVSSNIIENIISTDKVPEDNSTSIGRYLAAELFINFYTPTIVTDEDGVDIPAEHACVEDFTGEGFHYNSLRKYGNLNNLDNYCLTQKADINNDKEKEFVIDFNGLFATGVGIFVCWILLMYCISLGTRYVQLIYLQVIAPIPIMCYLAPSKDNMFSKWIKQCTTTYLDLFIRIGIINFAMFLCTMLLNNKDGIILNSAIGTSTGWITLFLVLGLLTFAKKAPDLVQELLPKSMSAKASGDFGLSLKKRSESMLGGKFAYSTGKKAIGFLGSVPGIVGATGVRAYNAHKYNQRENAKLEDYRANRIKTFEANKEKAIANWKKKGLNEEEIKARAARFDQRIDRIKNQSKSSLRRELRKNTNNLAKAYDRVKDSNPELAATFIEKINENRGSGMGHRSQGWTAATSIIGGTSRAVTAAAQGKSIGEIVKKANESQVKHILQEEGWYKDGGYASLESAVKGTISRIQRQFGIETEGQAVQYILDELEEDVKAQEEVVAETKAKEQGYKYGKNAVDVMKTKGSSEVDKNKPVEFRSNGTNTKLAFSSRTGAMESAINRLDEQYRTFNPQEAQQGLAENREKQSILRSFIKNIAENATADPNAQKLIEQNLLNEIFDGEEAKQGITVESAFNKMLVEGQHAVGKAKADYGKYQNAMAIMKYQMGKAGQNTEDLYENQDIELSYEGLMREVIDNKAICDDKDIKELVDGIKDFLTKKRTPKLDENGNIEYDTKGKIVYELKARENAISIENITEEHAREFAKLYDELEENLKEKAAEQERILAAQNEDLEARKELSKATKTYVGTTDKLNADKWGGK